MPPPFISTQDLSDLLGRDVTDDPGAEIAIEAACDICREIAGQDFSLAAGTTVALDGTGSDALVLPQRPVLAAGTVLVNGAPETAFTFTSTGLLFRGSAGGGFRPVWPRGRQNITVTYDHGFAEGAFPQSVRMVALQIAQRAVVQGAVISETVGAVSARYAVNASDLDVNELRILRGYRAPRS